MKKTIKTSELLKVYNIINTCKFGKMSDEDKIKVWKINRALKPTATKFDEDSKDAAEKLKPDGFMEKAQKMSELEQNEIAKIEGERTDKEIQNVVAVLIATNEEYRVYRQKELPEYNRLVAKAINEFADKEVEVEFDAITEDAFGKLLSSNEWTMEQATVVGEFIVEP